MCFGRILHIAQGPALQWRNNEYDSVSNHQPHDCLLNRLFGRRLKKHQSSASLAFVRGTHREPVNSPHKGPVTRNMFPFDDVIVEYSACSIGREVTIIICAMWIILPTCNMGWQLVQVPVFKLLFVLCFGQFTLVKSWIAISLKSSVLLLIISTPSNYESQLFDRRGD